VTACARYAPMIGARPGELSDEESRGLAEHLAGCEACQARLADDEALSGLLSQGLLEEANRRDFSTFADGVMERIERERAPGLAARLRAWVRRHRAAAAVSALAPALAALALIVYLGRAGSPGPAAVEVTAEGRGAILLETSDGPVVLFGDAGS
jgi:anti-sigma factor RsiW